MVQFYIHEYCRYKTGIIHEYSRIYTMNILHELFMFMKAGADVHRCMNHVGLLI